jgi:hypothetical protein
MKVLLMLLMPAALFAAECVETDYVDEDGRVFCTQGRILRVLEDGEPQEVTDEDADAFNEAVDQEQSE